MSFITTHILDISIGRPAAGVRVTLLRDGEVLSEGRTNPDGRCSTLEPGPAIAGIYELRFDMSAYNPNSFYPEVSVRFRVTNPSEHYHMPLLLSPFGYTTYRGS